MILLRFEAGGRKRHGMLEKKTVHEIKSDFFSKLSKTGKQYPLSKVKLLAPVEPSKIVAMGLNYIDHARELKMPIPLRPLFFLKAQSAVAGPGDAIVYPEASNQVDYEAELAVVIKKKTRNVSPKEAMGCVLGYTCLNDVTARDLQREDGQWARSKSFDTFSPIGPWIVTGIDPHRLKVETFLNGRKKQSSNTSELIFKIDELVSFVSRVMTLLPGDVISTGTPPGVGPMKPGDRVEVKIEKIGTLRNAVVK
ncbi:MAG: fumarylacetoacetate hydrolase family protein [Endomicrobiales bacterium]|nr:fumarylacetoacetate hydrolase family protein [Endomicrobiales bacterium]